MPLVPPSATSVPSGNPRSSSRRTSTGPIEVVVANAGIPKDPLLMRLPEDDFDSVVSTNLGGAFRVVKRASKGMLRARWGRVILSYNFV